MMQAHPRRLKAVFRQDLRLVVPLFQRAYVWNAEQQWDPLWQDVLATYERAQHGDASPHFMGAVVLQLRPGALGTIETREVIDGQQRLTTLQILISAVADTFAAYGHDNKAARRLRHLLVNNADMIGDDETERYKLWPTNRDRADYRAVMDGEYSRGPVPTDAGQIVQGYAWFRRAAREWLDAGVAADNEDRLVDLSDVLLDLLELVVIDLEKEDDAQVIFETLNARGTPLRASDLIKNLLFRTLQDAGRPVEQLYDRHWQTLEDRYWTEDVRLGRLTRERLDVFMGYFLVVELFTEVQSHSLFDATRRYVGNDADRAAALLEQISRYAEIYRLLDEGSIGTEAERRHLARLQIVDTQTLMPLLLWLFANTDGREREIAVQSLESYVVRRAICRMTPKNYNRLFLELLRRLGAGEGEPGTAVQDFLAGQRSESAVWPVDADVKRAVSTLPLYRLMRRAQLLSVLLALDDHARPGKTENFTVTGRLTLEHLMPQQWRQHWPLPEDDEEASRVAAERDDLLHTIGNLTAITGSLNSSLSNGPWETKREEILRYSALNLNRELPERWGVAAIRARSERLADHAVNLWWRPPADDAGPSDWAPEADADPVAPTRTGSARGDVAEHIREAFADLAPGTFLTINEIRRHRSVAYDGREPSGGAISARLFPANGDSSIQGVRPDVQNGVRGAVKL